MFRCRLTPLRFCRRRPWTALAVGLLLGAAAVAAVNLWAWHHYRAAEQALRDEELDEARQHIAQCLRVWRWGPKTYLLAARIERRSGHYPEAEQHLAECNRLQGRWTEATQLEQLMLRAQNGDLNEVEAGLQESVAADHPQSTRILEALAQGYLNDTRLDAALACLNQWLEREPHSGRALYWRGMVHERLQQPELALVDYRLAVGRAPARWHVRLRLVRQFLENHNAGEARLHLEELQRTHAEDAEVQVARAECLRLEGNEGQAVPLLDQTLAAHPRHFEALRLRGQLAHQQGRPAEAEEWLRRALAQRPADPQALYLLYQCLDEQGKRDEAARVLDRHKAIQADTRRLGELWNLGVGQVSRNPDMLSEVGILLIRLGEEKQGLGWLYRALEQDADHRPTHETLVRYYEAKGDTARAAEHRDRLGRLKRRPASPVSKE